MQQGQIETVLRRVNPKLLISLDPAEKRQAMEEFRSLYERILKTIKIKLGRVARVQRRLRDLEVAEEVAQREVKTSLIGRMEGHLRKREDYQLQKLKNYRRMEVQWKGKLKTISTQAKEQQKKYLQLSDRLSKEALLFWQTREEKAKSSTPICKPTRIATRLDTQINPTHFLTETDFEQPQKQLPRINSHSRVKGMASRSVAVQRHKSSSIQQHLVRSNHFWKSKQANTLQKVMEKMEKIEQTRSRGKQKLMMAARSIRQQRKIGVTPVREERYRTQSKLERSQNSLKSYSIQKQQLQQYRESRNILFSNVQKRRITKTNQQFQTRGQHFQQQLRKLRRQQCRKMVHQAVTDLKLQLLKSPRRSPHF